jgi:hypothetical protein
MYLITLLKSGVRLLVEILITACKLMSVKEHLYLFHDTINTLLFSPVLPKKYLFVYSSLNTRHSSPILCFFGGFVVSLKLEIYIFTVAKTKLKLTRSTRKALRIVSTLRMRIDVAVLVENTRRIFGRAQEGNLGSRRIFLTVLVGHKKLLAAICPPLA